MTIVERSPDAGSTVNMTPLRSDSTITCTTTAIAGSSSTWCVRRYATTRSPNRDAQHSTTRADSSSSPRTFVKVWFIPANDMSAVSSDVADDRTATRTSGPSV